MKMISLLSSGIDSLVATYMMLSQNVEVVGLHLCGEPYTDENALERFKEIVMYVENTSGKRIKAGYTPIGEKRLKFARECNRKLQCVLCKRLMYKVAEKLAYREKAGAPLTGEAVGQVASQTLENLKVINDAVEIPVIRPLIGLDKEDIIEIARQIGTYEISTQKGLCCGLVPKKPTTKARLDEIWEAEKTVNLDLLVKQSLEELRWLT